MEEFRKQVLQKRAAVASKPPTFAMPGQVKKRNEDYSPLKWTTCFDGEKDIKINEKDTFHLYHAGKEEGPLFVLLHGAGLTSLSWATTSRLLKDQHHLVAIDFRGHGKSCCEDEENLSVERICQDVVEVCSKYISQLSYSPPLVFVGHSMGGAIATRVVEQHVLSNIVGLVVLDVVEGTALSSLVHMQAFIQNRPYCFKSLKSAIEYVSRHGSSNLESVRLSVPSQLTAVPRAADGGKEEEVVYCWRTDLGKTEQHWKGWFEGLSASFLNCKVAKLLILAGTDRLDKPLTIAQMQGKFQLSVVYNVGHYIQEDAPEKLTTILCEYAKRNRF
eukprot:GCRY01002925.1.p1 GENE.GCRY01002925.1~~GCRY01002925.1.p1  ORF type:complete len:331 (-),score=32.50 GCRY01002925.1:71-1063(-)